MRISRSLLTTFPLIALATFSPAALEAQTTLSATPFQMGFYFQTGVSQGTLRQTLTVSGITSQVNVSTAVDSPGNVNWLFVSTPVLSPADGATRQIDITVIPSGLSTGSFLGRVRLVPATGQEIQVPVTIAVSTLPLVVPAPSTIEFAVTRNAAIPAAIQLTLGATTGPISASFSVNSSPSGIFEIPEGSSLIIPSGVAAVLNVRLRTTDLPIGTYTGNVLITSTGTGLSPVEVPLRLRVLEEAQVSVSPTALTFDFQVGGARPNDRVLSVGSNAGSVSFTAEAAVATGTTVSWLTVTPVSGNTPQNLTVGVQNLGSLAAGTYQGTITVRPTGRPAITVNVTLRVFTDPLLSVSPAQLHFTFQQGGAAPPRQIVVLSNPGNPVALTLSTVSTPTGWINVAPATANTPAAVLIGVTPGSLATGTYDGVVEARGSIGNSPVQIPVRLVITPNNTPQLRVSQNQINFAITAGATAVTQTSTIAVTSTGNATGFTATAEGGAGWLSVTPTTSQNTAANVTVTATPGSLGPGVYTGNVRIQGSETGSVPFTIPVRLQISAQPLLSVNPSSIAFAASGGTNPPRQSIAVSSTSSTLPFTVSSSTSAGGNWFLAQQTASSTPASIDVAATVPQSGDGIGLITVASSGVENSPLYIPVTLANTVVSQLSFTPAQLSFVQNLGAPTVGAQNVDIGLGQSGALVAYRVTEIQYTNGNGWVRLNKSGGIAPDRLEVSIDPSGLLAGQYSARIVVDSAVGGGSIPVFLEVRRNQANFTVTPESLTFNFTPGSPAPAAQTIQVGSSGDAIAFAAEARMATGSGWLQIAATSLTTPTSLSVSVNPANLPPGTYLGSVIITAANAGNSPRTVNVTLNIAAAATPSLTTFVNAASFQPTAAVPGLIVALGGTLLGPTQGVSAAPNATGLFEKTLAGVKVLFDGLESPVLFASATQVNAVVPNGLAGRLSTRVQVEYNGVRSNGLDLRVAEASPGIFPFGTQGQGAILNQDFTVNGPGNPAARDSIVVIYATGDGVTNPPRVDGAIPGRSTSLKRPILPVRVTIGGQPAEVQYAGSAPLLIEGVLQINAKVPANITPGGAVPIEIGVGSFTSPSGTTMAVR